MLFGEKLHVPLASSAEDEAKWNGSEDAKLHKLPDGSRLVSAFAGLSRRRSPYLLM
jgi:hypothetical protein